MVCRLVASKPGLTGSIFHMLTSEFYMPSAKKTIPIKSVPAKKPGTALTVWEQEMAAAAKAVARTEQIMGVKSISTRSGVMKIDDEIVPGNTLDAVILGSLHENQWFENDFDPKKTLPPSCYAYGDPEAEKPDADMKPHEKATNKQADACDGCWANKMGSAEKGRGKACKNVRRLILVTEDAVESAEELRAAEMRLLKVPVMSTNGWAKFVHGIDEDMKRPPWGVVTTISLVPDDKSQFRVNFEFKELVQFDQKLYDEMKAKVKQGMQSLLAPYPEPMEEEEEAPKRGARGAAPAKKAAVKVPVKKSKY